MKMNTPKIEAGDLVITRMSISSYRTGTEGKVLFLQQDQACVQVKSKRVWLPVSILIKLERK